MVTATNIHKVFLICKKNNNKFISNLLITKQIRQSFFIKSL